MSAGTAMSCIKKQADDVGRLFDETHHRCVVNRVLEQRDSWGPCDEDMPLVQRQLDTLRAKWDPLVASDLSRLFEAGVSKVSCAGATLGQEVLGPRSVAKRCRDHADNIRWEDGRIAWYANGHSVTGPLTSAAGAGG